jgi:hypothetical protein
MTALELAPLGFLILVLGYWVGCRTRPGERRALRPPPRPGPHGLIELRFATTEDIYRELCQRPHFHGVLLEGHVNDDSVQVQLYLMGMTLEGGRQLLEAGATLIANQPGEN